MITHVACIKVFVSFPPLETTAAQMEHDTLLSSERFSVKYSHMALRFVRLDIF